ncbi:MAG: L-threonylcarbamoyladenylate synthase [Lentisphaeria bacterium]|nr:L-threonylcarbamoyladenylate synthase [Lentisphaeria bacterium]
MLLLEEHDPFAVEKCVEALKGRGNVLLLPTETVYGLVCDYEDTAAREAIYRLKRRDKSKLLGAFLPDLAHLPSRCLLSKKASLLAEKFMPGPFTLVLPDGTGGTFGFRIPDHPLLSKILVSSGKILAQTSANLSGTPPALSPREALSALEGEVSLAVDGGRIPADSLSSTVVFVEGDFMKILREGAVPRQAIEDALQEKEKNSPR